MQRNSGTPEKNHYPISRGMVLVLGLAAWFIAGQLGGIITSLILGYTVFVGGVVFPTLAALFRDRLKIGSHAAFWAVIIGGGTAIMGKIQGGTAMKTLLTRHGQGALETLLGPGYLSILPILLSALILLVSSSLKLKAHAKAQRRRGTK